MADKRVLAAHRLQAHNAIKERMTLFGIDRPTMILLMVAASKARKEHFWSKALTAKHAALFLDSPEELYGSGNTYYELAVAAAKIICGIGKVVCPFVEDM